MRTGQKIGRTTGLQASNQAMLFWDAVETTAAIGGVDLSLASGTFGDNSGTGNGNNRADYYCHRIHNPDKDNAITVYVQLSGNSSKNYKLAIPAGGSSELIHWISAICGTGSGTSNAVLTLLYRERTLFDGDGEVALS